MHTTTATIKKKKTRRLGNTRNIPLKCREEKKKKGKKKIEKKRKGWRRKKEGRVNGWSRGDGWRRKRRGGQLKTARSIDILFRFLLRERLKQAIYLVYFHMKRSLARSQRRSRASMPSPPPQLFPFLSIPLHPGSPRFLHTRLRSILTETNIRIFVIPFAGYIESVFLSRKRTRRLSSLSSSPFLPPFDNWFTERKKERKVS